MRYTIELEATDLTEVVQKLMSCKGVELLKFAPTEESEAKPLRPVVGRKSRVKTPDKLVGQPAFVYNLLEFDKPQVLPELVGRFSDEYPHLKDPGNSLAPVLRVLKARGFVDNTGEGYFKVKLD